MKLSKESLEEFKHLYLSDHPNAKISEKDLLEMAICVLRIVKLIYHPIPKKRAKKFK